MMIQDKFKLGAMRILMLSLGTVLVVGCGSDSTEDPFKTIVTESPKKTYNLVWSDEFDGTTLNAANWVHETGAGGWGNNELQFYQADNTTVAGGVLTIEAREESTGSPGPYTSSRIISDGLQSFQFGKVDIRAKLPEGKGIWPALWMLGQTITDYPQRGEIDIMEMKGSENDKIFATIHWDDSDDDSGLRVFSGSSKTLKSGTFSDKFYVFSIEWDAEQIRWYVDGEVFYGEDITDPKKSELTLPFFFLINLAVGGDFDGDPDGSTTFPQQLVVDYIRVYEEVVP